MSENVIHLAYSNEKVSPASIQMHACVSCKNKTFTARADIGPFPVLYCAACGMLIGAFGWVDDSENGLKP